MYRKALRIFLVVGILIGTIAAVGWYANAHPALLKQLSHTSHTTLGLLLGLYIVFVAILALILHATLLLCGTKLDARESLLVTMYSSIINFFGPLQSGPAFRAVYLKKKHGVKLKNYTLSTLVYYFFFGGFSAAFLLSSALQWWLVVIAGVVGVGLFAIRRSKHRLVQRIFALNVRAISYLALATALQVSFVVVIYFVELHAVGSHASLSQVVTYTGAANLALFVSITPGAIGFRESFLIFSQHLHHVNNASIVAANLIDRGVYIVLLLFLAVVIFGTHTQRELHTSAQD